MIVLKQSTKLVPHHIYGIFDKYSPGMLEFRIIIWDCSTRPSKKYPKRNTTKFTVSAKVMDDDDWDYCVKWDFNNETEANTRFNLLVKKINGVSVIDYDLLMSLGGTRY